MSTSRRNFFKTAAISTPALAITGAVNGITGEDKPGHSEKLISDHTNDLGWLNARECGASGSTFQTTALTRSGSRQITVANVGDFRAGQGVMVSKCNIRYERIRMWSTGIPYVTHQRQPGNSFEVRGYDGRAGSWVIYIIDIAPSDKPAFRWSEDLGRTWYPEVIITHDWQPLKDGVEIKLNERDWEAGYTIAFGARDQLISRIEKIEGNVLTLSDEANRSVDDAVVRHNDGLALQNAVDKGIKEKLNVFVPAGHYMLAGPVRVRNAGAITIEGGSSVDTVLDISEGEGACFALEDGTDVIIRNFRMTGFMGFDEADKAGYVQTKGTTYVWGFGLKHCNAMNIRNTERVLVENCHASKMSGECFVSGGRSRGTIKTGESYTQWITYRRCSVTDCARNAFNDVYSSIENTSILNCRIVDVGGNSWEGASRFVKYIGNYMRNAGPVAAGNLGPPNREAEKITPENRDLMYPQLGAGQHIIADNIFDSNTSYGGRPGGNAIISNNGATQIIIRNNLFINFNSNGITVSGNTDATHYPSANTTITGNIFDLTCVGQKPVPRTAVVVSACDTIISDNQIYVRGKADPQVTAIRLREPALNVNIHDNLIRNCGIGVITEKGVSKVSQVTDNRTFLRLNSPYGLPQDRIRPETVNNWLLVWRDSEGKNTGISIIESFDPSNDSFRIIEPFPMQKGDNFEVIVPSLNWIMHDNTITDCLRPAVLDSYGSKTSLFRNNLVNRGKTAGVLIAIEIHGSFRLGNNHIIGFDEENATALKLFPDAIGRAAVSECQDNIFENCFNVIEESRPGLWKIWLAKNNITIECINKIPE